MLPVPVDAVVVEEASPVPVVLSVRRFMVGRSGSSVVVVLPLPLLEAVDELSPSLAVLSERRFIVGRSGSLDCVVVPFAEEVSVVVLPDDLLPEASDVVVPPESVEESDRRFIVGLSESSFEVVEVVDGFVAELFWSLLLPAVVLSLEVLFCSCGWPVDLVELVMTGRVFDGFNFAGLFATASGLTLP